MFAIFKTQISRKQGFSREFRNNCSHMTKFKSRDTADNLEPIPILTLHKSFPNIMQSNHKNLLGLWCVFVESGLPHLLMELFCSAHLRSLILLECTSQCSQAPRYCLLPFISISEESLPGYYIFKSTHGTSLFLTLLIHTGKTLVKVNHEVSWVFIISHKGSLR